ncbi:MAG: IS110 family transposase, partial [Burkholderiales bacterium]
QDGRRDRPAIHTVSDEGADARLAQLIAVIEATRMKWKLAASARVALIYEAGQDGFWIARALLKRGYDAMVVDPASIPVERRARRAKTDRLDVLRLVSSLRQWLNGERMAMHVVRIPTVKQEAERTFMRERGQLQKELGQHRDRIRKLLRTVGCWDSVGADFAHRLNRGEVRCHDGSELSAPLQGRLERESARLLAADEQLATLRQVLTEQLAPAVKEQIAHLKKLQAVGEVGATRLVLELFWRNFNNRRQVGSCVGLVPQPYNSGESRIDQGISKTGNRRVRALLIEMAWLWLRYQPGSAITKWFLQCTSGNPENRRGKRIAIVGVARRLAIALWRYLKDGVVPAGATYKKV